MSWCLVFPFGLGVARLPMLRKGSVLGSSVRSSKGSILAAGLPR